MHDIRRIREAPEAFDAALARRGMAPQAAGLVALDAERRTAIAESERLRAEQNRIAKLIGQAKAKGEDAGALLTEAATLKAGEGNQAAQATEIGGRLDAALSNLPNLLDPDVPDGADETANRVLHQHGTPAPLGFPARQHFEIGEALGLMEFAGAAKLAGARFTILRGALARLERALGQGLLALQTGEHGYLEVNPPVLVKDHALFGTSQLPKFEEDLFKTLSFNHVEWFEDLSKINILFDNVSVAEVDFELAKIAFSKLHHSSNYLNDERYLIPTAEVSLTNLVRDLILDEEKDLSQPMRLTALTNCFRAEAGSAGRDTKGMIRQHQFQKVELVSITTPEQSPAEHDRMVDCAETILKRLELPFVTKLLCTGDMGFSAQKTYDLEVWLPSQNTYREISSCSNCGDFQARRMDARYRKSGEKGTRFVHTLNGSGLAVGRTLVAIMENYQDEGGRIAIPAALIPYMGGVTSIG